MSVIAYNGINLPFAFTTRFDQIPVYDDVANTDWYCTKIDLQCNCIINIAYIGQVAPELSGATSSPAAIMSVIRSRLLQPRRTLSVKFNGNELIPAQTSGPGTVDVQNGPMPQACTITELTNTTFFVTYHIVGYYWENNDPASLLARNRNGSPVLFNRWTESVTMDASMYSRRYREGKFKIRSDNYAGWTVDQFRPLMATIGVPKGFLRDSSEYTVDPDGLAMKYKLTDKEVYKLPPQPAYECRGNYTETTGKGGAVRHGQVDIWLRGNKTVSQNQLLVAAIAIACRKISVVSEAGGGIINVEGGAILESASVRVNMYDNEVEVAVRVMYANNKNRLFGASILRKNVTFTPLTDDVSPPSPTYPPRGTAALLLQAAAYYDPDIIQAINPITGQFPQGLEVGKAGITKET